MNIRLSRNMIRFRLSEDEFFALREKRTLNEQIAFPGGGILSFSIFVDKKLEQTKKESELTYTGNHLKLTVCPAVLNRLCESASKECGFSGEAAVEGGLAIRYGLEIDLFTRS
ncbi:MAG: hypothetical protein HY537_02610 [Deltaproteobacteria bacterium]|nr:hypothetical protein [Deltaproteobacteria bacterium]